MVFFVGMIYHTSLLDPRVSPLNHCIADRTSPTPYQLRPGPEGRQGMPPLRAPKVSRAPVRPK
jgi:hypothetical protein